MKMHTSIPLQAYCLVFSKCWLLARVLCCAMLSLCCGLCVVCITCRVCCACMCCIQSCSSLSHHQHTTNSPPQQQHQQEGGQNAFAATHKGRLFATHYCMFWDKVLRGLASAELLFDDFELNDKLTRLVTALNM